MGKNIVGKIFSASAVCLLVALIPVSISSQTDAITQPSAPTELVPLEFVQIEKSTKKPIPIPLTMMWPVAESEITSHFGPRDTTGCWACDPYHTGLDFGGGWGQPIPAAVAGTVTVVGWHYGLGYWIVISDGPRSYVYGHLTAWSNPPEVYVGAQVAMGQIIGLMGSTGFSTGPHLHFEIWENNVTPIDPYPILKEQTVQRYQ